MEDLPIFIQNGFKWFYRRPKERAKLYSNFIYKLFQEIPDFQENKTVKDIHQKMMELPEYWEE